MNITPDIIKNLASNEVFVFGANEAGIHGAGAAKLAFNKFGAIWGKGFGLQGRSFGIPTKDRNLEILYLSEIRKYVTLAELFFEENPSLIFYVTKIGCGLAGYNLKDIAPLFKASYQLSNVYMPREFIEIKRGIENGI